MNDVIRVLLVDDHAVVRAGLRTLLGTTSGIAVAGEAVDANEAVAMANSVSPDVVVMDLSIGQPNGLVATRQIAGRPDSPRVLMLTMHAEEEYLLAALAAGALGYVTKGAAERELLDAIRVVARGDMYVRPAAARVLAGRICSRTSGDEQQRLIESLTERERTVLVLVAEGHTGLEVGERMAVSHKTIETYKHRISVKLGISGRPAFVRFALQAGLLVPRPADAVHAGHRAGSDPLMSDGRMPRP